MAEQYATGPLLISRWASRAGSGPRALRAGYVGIDERSFAEILSESVHFSRFLRYFDARDEPDGTWESLLATDQSAALALLATLDVERRTAALNALAARVRREEDVDRKEEQLRRLIGSVLRLAGEIDRWLGPAGQLGGAGHEARDLLERQIAEVLAPRLRRLLAIVAAVEREGLFREALMHRVGHFRSIWLIEAVETLEREYEIETWMALLLDEIVEHVHGFLDGVAALAAHSAESLDSSLETGGHAPHVGLLMAFIRLFRHAQDELNALPSRIASFYQEKILRERPRPALPDRTYLAFRPVPKAPAPEIAAGTLFPAGQKEDGTPIEFAADSALAVTGARLAAIRVWQPIGAYGARQRINAAAAPLSPDGRIGMNLFAAPSLPPAAMGIIVAAPALELKDGARWVTIRFFGVDPAPAADGFGAMLDKAFRLSFTSPAGWIDVPRHSSEVKGAEIAFSFAIAADGPPLARKAGPDPNDDVPDLPAVRLMLVQDKVGELAPLAVLGAMRFATVRIETAVDGLGGLVVSNSAGAAAAAPGAAAFGPLPVQGSWLRIDHPAFAAAQLDRLALGLTWLGLPADADGFAGYYRQYVVGPDRIVSPDPLFTDDSFKVDFCAPVGAGKLLRDVRLFTAADPPGTPSAAPQSAVDERQAIPGPAPPPPDRAAGENAALRSTTWLAVDADSPGAAEGRCPNHAVLVTLTDPPYGFGASLYAANVAYASTLIAAGQGREIRRESLASRLWRGLVKLLKKLLALILDALKAVIAPATMLWKLLRGGALWLRDLIFIRTDFYDHPEGLEELLPPPEPPSDGEISPAAVFPNPPWQPLLAGISVDFAAHAAWDCEVAGGGKSGVELFHVMPLEGRVKIEPAGRPNLLPPVPEQPCFDLRIAAWPAGKPLSLLFLTGPQPRADSRLSAISWQYRTDGEWRVLKPPLLEEDGTNGLSATGILILPPLAPEKKALSAMLTRVPAANDTERPAAGDESGEEADEEDKANMVWLRASASGPALGFPPIARILPDAIRATRIGVEGDRIVPPVPAETISQAPGVRGIARVEQPIESFGGAPAEEAARLPMRTSARLRHKERGVLAWDFEQLLLERFPEIDRVRVLSAYSGAIGGRPAPGHLTAIVVAARGGATPPDPLRPATPPDLREAIACWLRERSSPFARIHVVDPVYDPVSVRVAAYFGSTRGGAAMLRDDLGALLSPWSEDGLDLADEAGPSAVEARILQFVRARPYVAALQSVETKLAEAPPGEWRVPVAGQIDVTALARAPATGC